MSFDFKELEKFGSRLDLYELILGREPENGEVLKLSTDATDEEVEVIALDSDDTIEEDDFT